MMKKKDLMQQNAQLFAELENERQKNAGLNIKNSELLSLANSKESENAQLKQLLGEANRQVEQLSEQNRQLQNQLNDCKERLNALMQNQTAKPDDISNPDLADYNNTDNGQNTYEAKSLNTAQNASRPAGRDLKAEPDLLKDLKPVSIELCDTQAEQYGAKAIGRVAVKAAALSNLLAASSDQNAKDLLTLTLGRTEVFKAEVLSAVQAKDKSLEQICQTIDKLVRDTEEYFENLKAQLY